MKPTSVVAMLVGSGMGVAIAVVGYGGDESEPPPLPPAAARPVPKKAVAEPVRSPAAALAEFPAEPFPSADRPIGSREEFEAAAIACDEKDARACRRAATAADLGAVTPKDPERAKTFRKVELTIVVRACEKGAVEACLTLADRYLRGDGLEQNERTATALIEHTRELCARRPEDACQNVPKN
jgi:hypothetical protein